MGMEERKGSWCYFCVGQKVLFSQATTMKEDHVKYVGAMEGYEGVWVGVEWDSWQGGTMEEWMGFNSFAHKINCHQAPYAT